MTHQKQMQYPLQIIQQQQQPPHYKLPQSLNLALSYPGQNAPLQNKREQFPFNFNSFPQTLPQNEYSANINPDSLKNNQTNQQFNLLSAPHLHQQVNFTIQQTPNIAQTHQIPFIKTHNQQIGVIPNSQAQIFRVEQKQQLMHSTNPIEFIPFQPMPLHPRVFPKLNENISTPPPMFTPSSVSYPTLIPPSGVGQQQQFINQNQIPKQSQGSQFHQNAHLLQKEQLMQKQQQEIQIEAQKVDINQSFQLQHEKMIIIESSQQLASLQKRRLLNLQQMLQDNDSESEEELKVKQGGELAQKFPIPPQGAAPKTPSLPPSPFSPTSPCPPTP